MVCGIHSADRIRDMLAGIDRQDVGDQWRRAPLRLVLSADVFGELLFSAATVWLKAACADELLSIADNPLMALRVEVEPWCGSAARHR